MATWVNFAANSARSYVLVGFIFYLLAAVGWGIALAASVIAFPFWAGQAPQPMMIWFPSIVPLGLFTAASIGFALWSWATLQNVERQRYMEARTSSLILGIFGIVFALFVGGIFFLLAYSKLGEAMQPFTTGPVPASKVCTNCGRVLSGDARFCPHCGKGLPA